MSIFRKRVIAIKKLLSVLFIIALICCVFAGCSGDSDKKDEKTTVSTTVDPKLATDKAVIKEMEAISYIRDSYTKEELGLEDTKEDYSLMVASTAAEIDGEKYINVVANVRHESDTTTDKGEKTYTFKTIGSYYISFDGKKTLMQDMETGKYSELEGRYDSFKEKNIS